MADMLTAALDYIAQGFAVFPCKLDKRPLTANGLKDATKLQIRATEYWQKWPTASIAITTDGLVVLDFDKAHGGYESKVQFETRYGRLPRTRAHQTGGGGLHLLYRNPNGRGVRNTVGLAGFSGIDLRGDGGYIIVPPSPHPSGNSYLLTDDHPIIDASIPLMELLKKRHTPLPQASGPEGMPIPERLRNDTLTRLAGSMRHKGLGYEVILAALLKTNELQCQPPLEVAEVERIAKSVSRYAPEERIEFPDDPLPNEDEFLEGLETDNADITDKLTKLTCQLATDKCQSPTEEEKAAKLDGKVWPEVDKWLEFHRGEKFDLDTICRQLDVKNRSQRHSVIKKLSYLVNKGKLEKSAHQYTYINNEYVSIEWWNAALTKPVPISWPRGVDDGSRFGFDGHVIINPRDIIVIAGVSNMGKTAFALNMLWNNMDKLPCFLMGNEYEASKFKRRVQKMTWANPIGEDGRPKFELVERYDRWQDIIQPDAVNIIDWINLGDAFYQIGTVIQGIKSKLDKGIAVIVIQKDPNKDRGLGGGFSEHLSSLYLLIDRGRLTVRKVKEPYQFNSQGRSYGFQIEDGVRFWDIHEVKICPKCAGYGKLHGADCGNCFGYGHLDV